jgi:hypothetical protein
MRNMDTNTDVLPMQNPLLVGLRLPGETFRLPSHGLFYYSGELDETVVNGELEVYPMTAMEEIILSTPDKLLSGKAVTEIFTRCIPQIKQPGKLLSRDVDFLLVCLRMVTFGPTMEITFQHNCENSKEQHYTVSLQDMIRNTRSIDATKMNEEYTHTLPNNQVVRLKPMTYDEVVTLFQTTAMTKTDELSEAEAHRLIVDTLVGVIRDVEGVTDKAFITEWLTTMSLGWKRGLERAAQSVSQWGTEFVTNQVCKDCGEPIRIGVSANPVNFFM